MWTLLTPGQNEEYIPDTSESDSIGARVLYFIYQIFIIIILLNLLIAIMNSTVQRLQDKRQLYWKFVRTSIWIDHFDDNLLVPMPFSLLTIHHRDFDR